MKMLENLFDVTNNVKVVAKSINNSNMKKIIQYLGEHKTCYGGELVSNLGIKQPTVSENLRKLYKLGLVTKEHKGSFVYYSLNNKQVNNLIDKCNVFLTTLTRGKHESN